MIVNLNTNDLKALVNGTRPSYDVFGYPLVRKGGLSYDYNYDKITWTSLNDLTEDELWELYQICKPVENINLVVKIPVVESEAGWGRKIDDWMVCLSIDDANLFKEEFNSNNTSTLTPNWYMQVEGEIEQIQLSDAQFEKLKSEKRIWLSTLNKIQKT